MYVRLYSIYNNFWQYVDYTYTAAGAPAPAQMISPVNGSKLAGSSQTFTWSAGNGASGYQLWIGYSLGAKNIYSSGATALTSITVNNLPTTGATLYVRLTTTIQGVNTSFDYTYIAAGTPAPATLVSPTPGSTLTGTSQTFTWTAGNGTSAYMLWIGTSGPGSATILKTGWISTTSMNVTGLPSTGGTLYIRLYSMLNGVQVFNDYTVTAF